MWLVGVSVRKFYDSPSARVQFINVKKVTVFPATVRRDSIFAFAMLRRCKTSQDEAGTIKKRSVKTFLKWHLDHEYQTMLWLNSSSETKSGKR